MHTSNLYYLYLYSHFRVNGKRPLHIFFLCVVMCHCQCTEPHTTGLFGLGFFFPSLVQLIQVDGGGQSEAVLQGSRLYGMHARRLGLSVPRPVCRRSSRLHTCGPSAQSCLLWHLGCCLLQQHIFHPRHQPHQPLSHHLSFPQPTLFFFFFCISSGQLRC